jgi:hypothetical protein
MLLTSGIRVVLSYSLNISYSSSSHASLDPQPAAVTPAVPAHPSSPAQMSCCSSEAASSPRSSPPLARHVRRIVSALSCLERAAPAGGRGCRGRGTQATATRAARLTIAELAAARAEVKAAAVADAAHVTAAELETLRASSIGSSVSADDDRNNELKLAREATREHAAQWAHAVTVPPTAAAAQTGADVPAAGLTEITAFTDDTTLPPRTGTMVTMGSRPLSRTSVPAAGDLPSPRPTTSSGPR